MTKKEANFSSSEIPNSSDTISRQAALDVLDAYQVMVENGEENPYAWARGRMCELPSAQPERKQGEWIKCDVDWFKTMCKCSECGAMIDINEKYRNFFCYHCGARMDGEQDAGKDKR